MGSFISHEVSMGIKTQKSSISNKKSDFCIEAKMAVRKCIKTGGGGGNSVLSFKVRTF